MPSDRAGALRDMLLERERALPTSRLGRLWRMGRTATGLAGAALGRRRGELSARDLEAAAALVTRVGELKGVLMKVGQILGYIDPDMPAELRAMLSVLHTTSQASPFSAIEETLRRSLGERAGELLATMEREPVASASIAQVHRAELGGRAVAVKVLHPGIAEALRGDFDSAGAGAALASMLVPGASASVADTVAEARAAMLEECDLALEAERQRLFGELFAGDETIAVPAVLRPWCTTEVLVSEWLAGRSLDAFLESEPTQAERDRLGIALFRFYLGALYEHGLFHADPHPGNYAFLEDGRIAVYDFGCVRSFDRPTVAAFAALASATRLGDSEAVAAALASLGAKPPTKAAEREHLQELLRGFFAPLLRRGACRIDAGAGFETRALLRDKRALMSLSLPGRLLFLFRLRFGLYAVLARLGAVADWGALESSWAATTFRRRRSCGPARSAPTASGSAARRR